MAEIKHVFVLALENRSFDHIFWFSGREGVDAVTGQPTKAEDLIGKTLENTRSDGRHRFEAKTGGTFAIAGRAGEGSFTGDPSHEFLDVLRQISGPSRVPRDGRLPNGEYPPVNMSGFVADYQIAQPPFSPQIVMDSQDSNHLLILNQLAAEFMVCDHWFSALPGPTWPNRFFIHAASATGETDSASGGRMPSRGLGWTNTPSITGRSTTRSRRRNIRIRSTWRTVQPGEVHRQPDRGYEPQGAGVL